MKPDLMIAQIFELIAEPKKQNNGWKWIKCNFCQAEYPVGTDDNSHLEEGGHCEVCYKQDWSEVAE